MKTNKQRAACGISLKPTLRIIQSLFQSFSRPLHLRLAALALCATSAAEAQVVWDAGSLGTNTTATVISASGFWDTATTNLSWNNGTADVSWTQTSTTTGNNGAIFNGPDAPANTYQVNLDQGQIALTNLTINNSGYTFSGTNSGTNIFLNYAGGSGSAAGTVPLLMIADGKSVIFSNNLTGNNTTSEFRMGTNGAPATVVVYGAVTTFQGLFNSTNGSIFYLAGGGNAGTFAGINADVRLTNGTFKCTGACVIGRSHSPSSEPNNGTGKFTIGGTAIFNQTGDYLYCGRDGAAWNATLIVQDAGTLNVQTPAVGPGGNPGIGLPRPGSAVAHTTSLMFVNGGTVNLGGSTGTAQPIQLANGGSQVGEFAGLTQTGGVINAWGGIQIGGTGTYTAGGSAMVTNSGGFLYLGSVGGAAIRYGAGIPLTNNVSLSGGTVGALQSWISPVPMTLATLNGNITFQCADATNNPWNISLSGALTGLGGFNKNGSGQLTLSGNNTFAGSTVVSNGILQIVTSSVPTTNGVLTLDGSQGSPTVSVKVSNQGQNWNVGTLTTVNNGTGTPTLDFQHNGIIPSATVAPLQVAGNVNYTVTPNVSITNDTALPVGKFPLIQYTGTVSGTPPTVAILPVISGTNYCSGYVSNSAAAKTLFLVVTQSFFVPAIAWAVGSGSWDFTTPNWTAGAKYVDGDGVTFDDTASGTGNLAITLNTTVNPSEITFNNSSRENYTVSGTGSISGSASVTVLGNTGKDTLAVTNSYNGGTTVYGPGQLNINYGGNGGASSAIGAGALNLNTGSKIDNTSGQVVVLNTVPPIPVNWNDDWTFVGSTNLDLGAGQVTLGNISVVLTVVSNTLTVGNQITDNTLGYGLVKQGNGALTLSNMNSFSGGVTLGAGTLNIDSDGAVGTGLFAINAGAIDNTSGAEVGLESVPPLSITMAGNFTFIGTTNLDLGPATVNVVSPTVTLDQNTLITEGDLDGHNTGTGLTVDGSGTWDITGNVSDNALSITINGATVLFDKPGGYSAVSGNVTTVNTNGTLIMAQATGTQMNSAITPATTLVLGGGKVDMNGDSELLATMTFNSGTLMNSAPYTTGGLTANTFTLGGGSCVFDVTTNSTLAVYSMISGAGTLVETDQGILDLTSTNSYTGATEIESGTLLLTDPGEITNSVSISIAAGATLDATGRGDQTEELGGTATLTGNGAINGDLQADPGSTTAPGTASTVGTLTVTNDINLGGNLLLTLNRTNVQNCSQLTTVFGTITYGGTLSVTNVGPVLHVGDVFQLFPSAVSAFTGISLTTTDASGYVYAWTNNVAVDGSVAVASVTSPINPHPPVLRSSLTGRTLTLSWPTNAGWTLQMQTNSLAVGLRTNWVDVPGSSLVTSTNITIGVTNPSVFFRMSLNP
jgi:fibronectin-binding autotransporter adhesin